MEAWGGREAEATEREGKEGGGWGFYRSCARKEGRRGKVEHVNPPQPTPTLQDLAVRVLNVASVSLGGQGQAVRQSRISGVDPRWLGIAADGYCLQEERPH